MLALGSYCDLSLTETFLSPPAGEQEVAYRHMCGVAATPK